MQVIRSAKAQRCASKRHVCLARAGLRCTAEPAAAAPPACATDRELMQLLATALHPLLDQGHRRRRSPTALRSVLTRAAPGDVDRRSPQSTQIPAASYCQSCST
jgi:hypothetical protein